MTGRDAFKLWAPVGARWVDWVRPALFVAINDRFETNSVHNFTIPNISYISEPRADTAVIIDLPGYDSVTEGLALARLGFRPIPLYNGTTEQDGAMALVDNHPIESALRWGASQLETMEIAINAPPTFLLDSNRMHRFKMNVSIFDNSWDLYDQDIPSVEYFLSNGVDKIVVRAEKVHEDVVKILYKFQKKGITVLFTNGYDYPKEVAIKKPPRKDK